MLKSIKFLIVFALIGNTTLAQDSTEIAQILKKNEVGFEVLGLIDGQFQFYYERAVSNNFSVKLGIGYKTEEGLFKLSGIDKPQLSTDGFTYDGIKVIPEVRYYLNKTQNNRLDGFFFGAYMKHSVFKNDIKGEYTDSEGIDYDVKFDAKFNVTSFGLMVGYKLPIGKHFTIDFLIAGPGAGTYNFKLKNTQDLPDEFYDDLNAALEEYFQSIDIDFDLSKVNEKLDFLLPSFRYGVSLGYQF